MLSINETFKAYVEWCYREHKTSPLLFSIAVVGFVIAVVGIPSSIIAIVEYNNTHSSVQAPSDPLSSHLNPKIKTPAKNTGVFIRSAVNSASGHQLSDALGRRLSNIGIPVTSDNTKEGLDIEIESLTVDGPHEDNTDRQVSWTTTVALRIVIRRTMDNRVILTKDFSATTNPAADSPERASAVALLQTADRVVTYLDSNRQFLSPL